MRGRTGTTASSGWTAMDETVAAAARMLRTELDALEVVRAHPGLPQPPDEAAALIGEALKLLDRARRMLDG